MHHRGEIEIIDDELKFGIADVAIDESEVRVEIEVIDVLPSACGQVVNANNLVPTDEKSIAKMRAEKPCPSSDEDNPLYSLLLHEGLIGTRFSIIATLGPYCR